MWVHPDISGKKACVHRAYPGSIKNAFQEYNRESSVFWVSRHEVSPPMMRMSGHGTHVAGQESDLTAHTHNTRIASINLLSISSRQHVHANDCNAVIITTIICACKRIVQTTALQGGKGESFSAVDFTRFGSEMVIYWAANGIGVLAVLDQIGIWGKSILPPSAHAVEQQDIIRCIFVNIFLLYTSRTKLCT